MGRPVSLFIVVLLCPSLLRPLSSQEVASDSPTSAAVLAAAVTTVAPVDAGDPSTDPGEVQTSPSTGDVSTPEEAPVAVTTPPSTSPADSTPEADSILDQTEQVTTSLPTLAPSTEAETTTATGLTTQAAETTETTETTTTPQTTTEARGPEVAQTTGATDDPTTSLSTTVFPTTSKTTSSPPPPPTTPGTTQSSSTPITPKATTVEDTTEVTTTLSPTTVVTPLVLLKTSPITHVASITPNAVGVPVAETNNDQSNMPLWLWIVIAALVAMLVGAVCIALLVQRRKKRTDHVIGGISMNGRSQRSKKKKKGEDDVWAGPVLMSGEGNNCEGKGGDGDHVEANGGGGQAETAEPMLSSFAPSDEEKAVGADGTKEARRWSERSPLLYIDEDAEEGKAAKEEPPPVFSQDGGSTGKTEAGGAGQQETGGTSGETREVLNGGIAFCQTTAV